MVPGLGFTIARGHMKKMFFDKPAVMRLMDQRTLKSLRHTALYVRKVARNSIKSPRRMRLKEMSPEELKEFRAAQARAKAKGEPAPKRPRVREVSKPGNPPFNQTGLLRDGIMAGFEPSRRVAIVGPERLNKPGFGAEALEYGGFSEVAVFSSHGTKRERRYIAARPYMRPALKRTMGQDQFRKFWGQAA